ncbi:hypothetical protein [Levilactobacillus fujinensis]|uniref:Uncharacterized protein n=1 Tax=Levilactobacillus fujinensis TaxID=2486024 RepID=A0ABW1TGI9_9LACO|nr:hypothetical protein [Levilactobacillus fujinensis]
MQEVNQATTTVVEEHPVHAKLISGVVALVILLPLIITISAAKWASITLLPLLIIAVSLGASVIGVWRVSEQLVTVIREGGDSDFRER